MISMPAIRKFRCRKVSAVAHNGPHESFLSGGLDRESWLPRDSYVVPFWL